MTRLYLASPLGFSPEHRDYLTRIKERLDEQGITVFDPWAQTQFSQELERAFQEKDHGARVAAFAVLARRIGAVNEQGIRDADCLLAVVDGAEVDSGTAAEVGFACGLGKRCYALRTDLRDSGDFVGIPVNLQLLHFVETSGGKLFRNIAEILIPPKRSEASHA
ncbi:2-deoxyribonucleoside glycosidase [Geomonas silvestris]|uniref:2-deoxyribonucleoside glycosidase n=1 Tax=Geomonas silvestris TaxID=2740184 RepID=A0A6V8MEB5_9BACT|nr:nucleoside 2-deoxyribosyltransferase [Geomonas silvestris]GFO58336.1 2-deoxyribonucleoside glycosidase [Geomonas silvestris]